MKVVINKAVITEVFHSDKSGSTYVTFVDLDDGSMCRLSTQGKTDIEPGNIIEGQIDVSTRVLQGGGVQIKHRSGVMKKV